MKRTHNNLNLLNFVMTEKESDSFQYMTFAALKRYLKRQDLIRIIHAVKANPEAKCDTGVTYIITESNSFVHSVQWFY